MKNVLVGFEESQTTTIEFRKLGIAAYSCDLKPSSAGFFGCSDWHLQCDIFHALALKKWDLIILHPPCTYTALSGNRWYYNSPLRLAGADLCKRSWEAALSVCAKVVLEQPNTIMQKYLGPKSQVIHPWMFGHGETKETWLWIRGLPLLKETNVVPGRLNRIWKMGPSPDRQALRSKTYPGIANALASQYAPLL